MDTINDLAISNNGFIFDPSSGNSYRTNEVGLFIIECLKENQSKEKIIEDLLEHYEIDKNEVEVDLIEFFKELKNNYLLKDSY